MSQFYLKSRHGNCGTNVMFHAKNGRGYTTDLNKAHAFEFAEAQRELDFEIKSIPLLKDTVDERSILSVDHQYLNNEGNAPDQNNEYLIQKTNLWNGNDIYFISDSGRTQEIAKAKVFSIGDALTSSNGGQIWSKSYIQSLVRPTFQEENINIRKMVTGAGIKYKKPRKKKATTGKTMMNCPSCGRIHWQYDSHEFDSCSNHNCSEFQATY